MDTCGKEMKATICDERLRTYNIKAPCNTKADIYRWNPWRAREPLPSPRPPAPTDTVSPQKGGRPPFCVGPVRSPCADIVLQPAQLPSSTHVARPAAGTQVTRDLAQPILSTPAMPSTAIWVARSSSRGPPRPRGRLAQRSRRCGGVSIHLSATIATAGSTSLFLKLSGRYGLLG